MHRMAQRLVTEADCSNDKLDRLTAEEERLYRRLSTASDDYGLFDGRPKVIRSDCWKLNPELVSPEDIERWLQGMASKGVIKLYEIDGQRYGHMLVWSQRTRAARAKFPPPPGSTIPGPSSQPHGSPDLPAEPRPEVPPSPEQGAVPAGEAEREAQVKVVSGFERDGRTYRDWEHWFEQRTGTVPGQGRDAQEIRSMREAGTEDALIVEAIVRAISKSDVRMKLAYAKGILAEWALAGIRTLRRLQEPVTRSAEPQQQLRDRPSAGEPPGDEPEDQEAADRARRLQALLRGDGNAAAAAV